MQDKSGEETDKVKKNILETLASNKTAVVIKARIETIKWRGEAKDKGQRIQKWGKGTFKRKMSQKE